MLNLINFRNLDTCDFYKKNNKFYLVVSPTTFFQFIRLGDLSLLCTILYIIKLKFLIRYPDKFNHNNLFFLQNDFPQVNYVDVFDVLKYSPYLFDPEFYLIDQVKQKRIKYNVAQVLPRIHNQNFNMFFAKHNFQLSINDFPNVPLIPQNVKSYHSINKNNAMILPVIGKNYNVGRNQNVRMIINLINSLPDTFDNIFLINKDNYILNLAQLIPNINKNNVMLIDQNVHQNAITDMACQLCNTFISGDCGFSHLLSKMYNSPDNIIQFYRTNSTIDYRLRENYKKFITDPDEKDKLLVGVDEQPLINQKIQSIYPKNVIFQNNQDGFYLKPDSSYQAQFLN